jgi:hypothetical protein
VPSGCEIAHVTPLEFAAAIVLIAAAGFPERLPVWEAV